MNPKNSTAALDLYAKVEDLLGVKESAPRLYAYYLMALQDIEFDSLLDVGCGSGDFLHSMARAFVDSSMSGIDLSPDMVKKSNMIGLDAACIDLCDLDGSFDVITAVFDMLNYLDSGSLKKFLLCVHERLGDNGYFFCDINTLYGFEEIAVGNFIADDDDRFLTVDSDFEDGVYSSEFTLFEQRDELYVKSQEQIFQYYHSVEAMIEFSGLELILREPVCLYGDESDKEFLVFRKQRRKI